jgi:2-polyprenyl-3-methyl-5-hydroxy-6-metoxy-1,4-benzoquinol methylase
MQNAESIRDQVISANVAFYREIAEKYDHYESCASDESYQRMLDADLDKIQASLSPGRVYCLDCGGGSGNLTLKMLKRGWKVTVVDVSPDMLEISRAKVRAEGHSAEFVNDSIEHFLSSNHDGFTVITFSSVLHHLYSPVEVVREVSMHVMPGGFFYSNFDPVRSSSRFLTTCFGNVDTVLAKIIRDQKDLLPGVIRRIRKWMLPPDVAHKRVVGSAGDLAEYHARNGVDDRLIAETLERQGFVVNVERYPAGRTRPMLWGNHWLRAILNFKIMSQRRM